MKINKYAFWISAVAATVFAFQNCSSGIDNASVTQSSTSTPNPTPGPTPGPAPGPAPAPTPTPSPAPQFSALTGVSSGIDSRVYSVAQGGDLSMFLAGYNQSTSTSAATQQAILTKLSSTGQLVWSKSYAGPQQDQFFSVIRTSDGNLLAAGFTRSFVAGSTPQNGYIVKINPASGAVIWAKIYKNALYSMFYKIAEIPGGGYVAVGAIRQSGNAVDDALVMRLDASGAQVWAKSLGGTLNERFTDVMVTVEGVDTRILASGFTESYGGASQRDGLLAKYDSAGAILWSRNLGGTVEDRISGMVENVAKDAYILAVKADIPSLGGADTVLAKVGHNGATMKTVALGSANFDEPFEVIGSNDGNLIVGSLVGNDPDITKVTNFNVRVTKVSEDLNLVMWNKVYGKAQQDEAYYHPLMERADHGLAIGLASKGYSSFYDSMLVQTDSEGKVNSTLACMEVVDQTQVLATVTIANSTFAPIVGSPAFSVVAVTPTVADIVSAQLNACVP